MSINNISANELASNEFNSTKLKNYIYVIFTESSWYSSYSILYKIGSMYRALCNSTPEIFMLEINSTGLKIIGNSNRLIGFSVYELLIR